MDASRRSLMLGGLACAVAPASALAAPRTLPSTLLSAPWTDSDGATTTLGAYASDPIVMTMSYTACRRYCSTAMLVMAELEKSMEQRGRSARFVVVSYDPANDTPEQWTRYRTRRGLTRPNWHFLSGGDAQTRAVGRYLDLSWWDYHGHILHDFRIAMFDPGWRYTRAFEWNDVRRLQEVIATL